MAESARWTAKDIPDLTGKVAVVTGANSGLGLETARELARKGAHVVVASRDATKANTAVESIRATAPWASLEVIPLDLASLEAISHFADEVTSRHARLDILCNNAGVMALPLCRTRDGFEMQIGTNHLGHFALTGRLLPRLLSTPSSRVVTVSSTAHRIGRMRLDDLSFERGGYGKWAAYGQSKLANLLFAYELQRRLTASGASTISVAAHPGYAATNLQFAGPRMEQSTLMERVMEVLNRIASQDASMGALPTLYGATASGVAGGDYFGPDSFGETWGHPRKVSSTRASHDLDVARGLWSLSEQLTGVRYDFGARASAASA